MARGTAKDWRKFMDPDEAEDYAGLSAELKALTERSQVIRGRIQLIRNRCAKRRFAPGRGARPCGG
jgi:hypothetical protein